VAGVVRECGFNLHPGRRRTLGNPWRKFLRQAAA
jgi:hypothetical protein